MNPFQTKLHDFPGPGTGPGPGPTWSWTYLVLDWLRDQGLDLKPIFSTPQKPPEGEPASWYDFKSTYSYEDSYED